MTDKTVKFSLRTVAKYPAQIIPERPPHPSRRNRINNSFGPRNVKRIKITVFVHSIRPLNLQELTSILILEKGDGGSRSILHYEDGSSFEI